MSNQLRRIAILSVHTSPLHQPGRGDAGGMNVYIYETAKRLAARGIEVEVFTRATSADDPELLEVTPGFSVRHIPAGPFEGLRKEDLPGQLCAVTAGLLRAEAERELGFYDLIHSHYWLSGQVGWIAKERWQVPLVHTMHTMGRVKNRNLARGEHPEPQTRIIGEEQVVAAADRLVANTETEARELVELYSAEASRIRVVPPGVDLTTFTPGDKAQARHETGLPKDALVLLFVGRIQPLKAPDVLLKAAAELLRHQPELRDKLRVVVNGAPSGTGLEHPSALADLAQDLGISEVVIFEPPGSRERLLSWMRSADLVLVPSYSESFGLVAIEAQACGIPVVAARVGGLATAVRDGFSGVLVDGHDAHHWAHVLQDLIDDLPLRTALGKQAVAHAANFDWEHTTEQLIEVYAEASAAQLPHG